MPLAVFLKQYFQQNKKFGSKDRRYITQACYACFRTGHAIMATTVEERIKASLFLCGFYADEWAPVFSDEWLEKWNDAVKTDPAKIFLWINELSDGIDPVLFSNSHLIQPDLFLRIRPGKQKTVLQKLNDQVIPYQLISDSCLSLPNATKIDSILAIDKEVVIQDFSSQRIAEFLPSIVNSELGVVSIWDCCAASGGKSLLAFDVIKNIKLTVSDVRPSILRNLKTRFENAGIKNYHSFVGDIAEGKFKIHPAVGGTKFKIILCDAPCSGSGTWGRTPEQLFFFREEKINEYAALQKKIVTNVIPYIENGGYLLYITCSVFKKENEEVAAFIQNNPKLEMIKMELLKGYDKKADSMFAVLFKLRD